MPEQEMFQPLEITKSHRMAILTLIEEYEKEKANCTNNEERGRYLTVLADRMKEELNCLML